MMYLSTEPTYQVRYEGCFRDEGFETLKLLRTAQLDELIGLMDTLKAAGAKKPHRRLLRAAIDAEASSGLATSTLLPRKSGGNRRVARDRRREACVCVRGCARDDGRVAEGPRRVTTTTTN